MALCLSQTSLLQKPAGGLVFPSTGSQSKPPFTLNGAPLSNPPQSLKELTEYRRKAKATTDTSEVAKYFALENYYTIQLATENILGPDPNTTLKFNSLTYSLEFAALHKGIWTSNAPQLSFLFCNKEGDGSFFHICIPIEYPKSNKVSDTENQFLKFWLYKNPSGSLPSPFTINDIFNFRGSEEDVRCATLEYCLQFNGANTVKPYIFCIFKTPLIMNLNELPDWLRNDPNISSADDIPLESETLKKYRLKSFNDIFNYVLRGRVNKYVYTKIDPYLTSSEEHFDNDRTQNNILPTYYKTTVKTLGGTKYNSENFYTNGRRSLNNIKCYPIDLASQVDDNGNIFINEQTNKPVAITSLTEGDASASDPALQLAASNAAVSRNSWIVFLIIFSIIGGIIIILLAYVIPKIFNSKTAANNTELSKAIKEAINPAVPPGIPGIPVVPPGIPVIPHVIPVIGAGGTPPTK